MTTHPGKGIPPLKVGGSDANDIKRRITIIVDLDKRTVEAKNLANQKKRRAALRKIIKEYIAHNMQLLAQPLLKQV